MLNVPTLCQILFRTNKALHKNTDHIKSHHCKITPFLTCVSVCKYTHQQERVRAPCP